MHKKISHKLLDAEYDLIYQIAPSRHNFTKRAILVYYNDMLKKFLLQSNLNMLLIFSLKEIYSVE